MKHRKKISPYFSSRQEALMLRIHTYFERARDNHYAYCFYADIKSRMLLFEPSATTFCFLVAHWSISITKPHGRVSCTELELDSSPSRAVADSHTSAIRLESSLGTKTCRIPLVKIIRRKPSKIAF